MSKQELNVAVTIDVEEDGLFTGSYCSEATSVTNVKHLWKLDPVFRDFEISPTLFTSYQVAKSQECKKSLSGFMKRWGAEIGAHLHHWNTDPIVELGYRQPVPSELIPVDVLGAKMESLIKEVSTISGDRPTTFRMGRFNLGPKMFQILEELGFRVDSSIEPLRSEYGGPDHLTAPSDPYYPDSTDPTKKGSSGVLEVPITINPILGMTGLFLKKAHSSGLLRNDQILRLVSNVVSVPAQPAWVGLRLAKIAVRFHKRKGGRFLTIFFHSSELAPGLNPLHPDEDSVQRFLIKLKGFFTWLKQRYDVKFITLSQAPSAFKQIRAFQ